MVDIKPLTILLGKNSSGKSSFLRLFPLFKQSVSTRTRGALAFFGDEVDFGDFNTTLSKKKGEKRKSYIEFDFNGSLGKDFSNPYIFPLDRPGRNEKSMTDIPYETNLKISYNRKKDISYISNFTVKIFDNTITFSVGEDSTIKSFVVNKKHCEKNLKRVYVYYSVRRPGFPSFLEADDDHSLTSQLSLFMVKDAKKIKEIPYGDLRFFRDCRLLNKRDMKLFLEDEKNLKYVSNSNIKTRIKEILAKKSD